MKNKYLAAITCAMLLGCFITGCGQKSSINPAETTSAETVPVTEPVVEPETVTSTESPVPAISAELTGSAKDFPDMPMVDGRIYSMKTENSDYPAPSLTLYDNGCFGFSYDVLSSYYAHGSYEIQGDKLIAATDDGRFHYVFKIDSDQYVFIQDESSEVSLTDDAVGIPVTDGAQFVLYEVKEEDLVQMTAVVKEIAEETLLVTSLTDQYPGAYYVYCKDLDISGIKGGDKIVIDWNGMVQETSPGQIRAIKLEKIGD